MAASEEEGEGNPVVSIEPHVLPDDEQPRNIEDIAPSASSDDSQKVVVHEAVVKPARTRGKPQKNIDFVIPTRRHRPHLESRINTMLYGLSVDEFDNLDASAWSGADVFDDYIHTQRNFLQLHLEADGLVRREQHQKPEINFPTGATKYTQCQICFSDSLMKLRVCCSLPVCDKCLRTHITIQVQQGTLKIPCLNDKCNLYLHRNETLFHLSADMREKFYHFLVDANASPNQKTCPQCSHVTNMETKVLSETKSKHQPIEVICESCGLKWCFSCHAPFHHGFSCKEYMKGDKLLKKWAKDKQLGQVNAQRCPKCKIFIQRSQGCDHMSCNRCGTNFCYKCGDRYRDLRFIGDHYSKFSVLGCKYRYYPNKPIRRRFIRGSILGGKVFCAPVLAGLAVAAGAVLVGASVFILPAYAGYRIHKAIRTRKLRKEYEERRNRCTASAYFPEIEVHVSKPGDDTYYNIADFGGDDYETISSSSTSSSTNHVKEVKVTPEQYFVDDIEIRVEPCSSKEDGLNLDNTSHNSLVTNCSEYKDIHEAFAAFLKTDTDPAEMGDNVSLGLDSDSSDGGSLTCDSEEEEEEKSVIFVIQSKEVEEVLSAVPEVETSDAQTFHINEETVTTPL